MAATLDPARSRATFLFAVGVATALAAWLRAWGVTGQVVLDDEWHAIHKLATSTYRDIFTSFGQSDHSIPLTLLYKYMAQTIGLAEGRLRMPQILCGIALVPACAWLAWGAVRDRAAAALFAFLVAGAPFLVMWSRFARPYSVTLLLTVLCIAAIWRWRTERSTALAAAACITAALSAWLHPIAALYPMLACLFVFVEDFKSGSTASRPPWRESLVLGACVGLAMAVLLMWPFIYDRRNLTGKKGGDRPTWDTYERTFSVIFGGLPTAAYVAALALAACGFIVTARRQPRFAAFLAALAFLPGVLIGAMGTSYLFVATNFLRYQLPLQIFMLFTVSVGAVALTRVIARGVAEPATWLVVYALTAGYLVATPAIMQVARLDTWYLHINYHWDYRYRWMDYLRADRSYDPPDFYRQLGQQPPGTIIEAPFVYEFGNRLAYYATYHHQRELFGMLHDLCMTGDRVGEVPPNDRRFRFRRFVFLDDPIAVRASDAKYLVFHRDFQGRFARLDRDKCIVKLEALYGAPIQEDARVVVWELNR